MEEVKFATQENVITFMKCLDKNNEKITDMYYIIKGLIQSIEQLSDRIDKIS